METKWIGCPASNFRKGRPNAHRPEAVVVHIMDGSFAAGESVFLNHATQKSAHYGISTTGEVHQYVDEVDTAFHAGIVVRPVWDLLKPGVNPNFYTVGIEHAGRPDDVWPDTQLTASAALIGEIATRWNIPIDAQHIVPHHVIRNSKTCPGNWLDLKSLIRRVPQGNGTRPAEVTSVRILKNANLRSGAPNTKAPISQLILAGTQFAVAGAIVGETVAGNHYWYANGSGGFLWAGATDTPNPVSRSGLILAGKL
jgi:N-acetyl-anhydromuramyl-L-alanine amidase AmpD